MSDSHFDFAAFVDAKAKWSRDTFGPQSIVGLRKHIDKELAEIDAKPGDLIEWVDLVLLAIDGVTKHAGATGAEFVRALVEKMDRNRARQWPDWRALGPDEAREHVRDVPPSVDAQPRPTTGDVEVWPLVLKDIEARMQFGMEKYGVPLRTNDGRDSLIDAYQESLDQTVYLRKAIEERRGG